MHYITLTGFQSSEREALHRAISSLSTSQPVAKYLPDLVHVSNAVDGTYTTVLCCKSLVSSFGSEKFHRALEWGIPVVSWRWIEQSIALRSIQPFDHYKTDSSGLDLSDFISRFPPINETGKENQVQEVIKYYKPVQSEAQGLKVTDSKMPPLSEATNRLHTPQTQSRSASSIHIPSQLSLNQMMAHGVPSNGQHQETREHSHAGDSEFSFRPHHDHPLNQQSRQEPKQLDFDTRDENDAQAMDISPEMNAGFKSRRITPMSIDASGSRRCFSFSPLPAGLEISMTPAAEKNSSPHIAPPSVLVEHDMIIPATQCDDFSSLDSPKSLISYLKTRQVTRGTDKDGVKMGNDKTSTRLLYSWTNGPDDKARSLTPPLDQASPPSIQPPTIEKEVVRALDPSPALPGIQPQHGRLSEFIDPGLPSRPHVHSSPPQNDTQDRFSSPPPDSYDYQHELDQGDKGSFDEIEESEERADESLVRDLEDDLNDEDLNLVPLSQSKPLSRLRRGSLCPSSISKQPAPSETPLIQNKPELLIKPPESNIVTEGERLKEGGGAAARALAAARAARMAGSVSSRPVLISNEVAVKQEPSSSIQIPSDGARVTVLKLLARPPRGTSAKDNRKVCIDGSSLKGVEFADEIMLNGRQITCRDGKKKITCPLIALPSPCPYSYVHSEQASPSAPLYPIEPYAVYRRGDGDWWIEFHRLLSFSDALTMAQGDQSNHKATWLPSLAADFDPTREVFRALQPEHSKLSNLRDGQVTLHKTKKVSSQGKAHKGTDGDKVLCQRFGWDMEERKVLVALEGQDLVID